MIATASLPSSPLTRKQDGAVKRVKKFFARAHSIKAQVQSKAQTAADQIQLGIQTSAKVINSVPALLHDKCPSKENSHDLTVVETDDCNLDSNQSTLSSHYLTIRLDRKRRRLQEENNTENRTVLTKEVNDEDREMLFAVSRSRADAIYNLLLEWSSNTDDVGIKQAATAIQNAQKEEVNSDVTLRSDSNVETNNRGLLVVETKNTTTEVNENQSEQPNGSWELVTVRELCRRLSLEEEVIKIDKLPLPEGSEDSQILDDFMIRQMIDVLPPRAQSYKWQTIYNSDNHGYSLATLYRNLRDWIDDLSPILFLIRDTEGHVFGAIASSAPQPKDCYFGTGDSSLLFRFVGEYPNTRELISYTWTGENQFFINATKEFLSFGAGGGHYGLYLDADLNVGRSQRCATFNNEPLAGGVKEDFQIQFVEAFGFSII
ncbi:TLDc domain-containing protein [Aphelenchoides besseyi]|nr:TLDc domain-containing protein [Aphelenchoides besseyi]KAI6199212.1 TLDc domain-containing protein [Aphelenchoides besseyi]